MLHQVRTMVYTTLLLTLCCVPFAAAPFAAPAAAQQNGLPPPEAWQMWQTRSLTLKTPADWLDMTDTDLIRATFDMGEAANSSLVMTADEAAALVENGALELALINSFGYVALNVANVIVPEATTLATLEADLPTAYAADQLEIIEITQVDLPGGAALRIHTANNQMAVGDFGNINILIDQLQYVFLSENTLSVVSIAAERSEFAPLRPLMEQIANTIILNEEGSGWQWGIVRLFGLRLAPGWTAQPAGIRIAVSSPDGAANGVISFTPAESTASVDLILSAALEDYAAQQIEDVTGSLIGLPIGAAAYFRVVHPEASVEHRYIIPVTNENGILEASWMLPADQEAALLPLIQQMMDTLAQNLIIFQ